jgi:uncharacterized protein YPO0396
MTRNRHVKTGRQRHEKDDRDHVSDPRNFVLGWDNHEKKQRSISEIERLTLLERTESLRLESISQQLMQNRIRLSAIDEVMRVTSFTDVDFAAHEREIDRLEEESRAIEQKSDVLQLLKQRLMDAESELTELRAREHQFVGDERALEIQISQRKKQIAIAQVNLDACEVEGRLAEYREVFAELDGQLLDSSTLLDRLNEVKDRFHDEQTARILRLRGVIEPLKNQLTNLMSRYLRE